MLIDKEQIIAGIREQVKSNQWVQLIGKNKEIKDIIWLPEGIQIVFEGDDD